MREQNLIQRAQKDSASNNGVTSSFSQLVTLYQARLYQYLLARCHNSYDAEDVLQETFISAYKYLHSYNPQWQFSTWLFTIANRLIKKQKKLYYQNNEVVSINHTTDLDTALMDQSNIWVQIKKILSSAAYDVLWFFYIEELTIKEIAKILQYSQSWVKISLFRSKKKLAINKKIKILSQDFLMEG
ncbi:MAG: sigma-70 family RNA polymerase sigma factor [Alcanivoracaceae bacterium]|nr:sigma-70 family RNA polymerase sigma factor [Alcanivoracaceae bacterium]